MIAEALLLGLSSGTYCSMYCGPVLIPFLFGADKITHKKNTILITMFLFGRLVMYCALSLILGSLGILYEEVFNPVFARKLSVLAYFFTGLILFTNSLGFNYPWVQEKYHGCKVKKLRYLCNDYVTALLSGLSVGLHICPPLWIAMFRAVAGCNGRIGMFYLILFYFGTLPYFIPLFGIPFLNRFVKKLKPIARITQLLVSIYFIVFAGLIPLFFGA